MAASVGFLLPGCSAPSGLSMLATAHARAAMPDCGGAKPTFLGRSAGGGLQGGDYTFRVDAPGACMAHWRAKVRAAPEFIRCERATCELGRANDGVQIDFTSDTSATLKVWSLT